MPTMETYRQPEQPYYGEITRGERGRVWVTPHGGGGMSSSEEHEGEPLLPSYDQPHSITREFETNTLWAGGTNLLKALLGVGVLVIPRLTA